MDKHILALTTGLSLVVAGCFAPVANQSLSQVKADGPQIIDFAKGVASKPGYGTINLKIEGLPDTRQTQSVSEGMVLFVAVTKQNHATVKDITNKQAVYKATVTNGSALLTLPPLPNTSSAASFTANSPTGYLLSTFLFKAGTIGSIPLIYDNVATYSVTPVGPGGNLTAVSFDKMDNDQNTASPVLRGSGEVISDVLPGFPVSVTMQNWFHITTSFVPASNLTAYTSISGFTQEGTGNTTLRLRHPGLKNDQFADPAGAPATNFGRVVINLGAAASPNPSMRIDSIDNTNPILGTTAIFANTATTLVTPAQLLSSAIQSFTYFSDVDFVSLATNKVANFTFTSLPTGSTIKFLSRDTTGAFSNDNGNNTVN